MIHSDLMNTLSLCTKPTFAPEAPLMDQLEQYTRSLGWIWSAGENQKGFWCEIFTPQEVQVFQGSSLDQVLHYALHYITKIIANYV